MPTDEKPGLLEATPRTALRRKRERGSYERDLINAVLDEALVCHVGFVAAHGPVVLPMTYVRIGDDLYLHGASGNDMLRHLAGDADVCVTVTLLDALVFARSVFHHSMNFRCVVVFGQAERVTDVDEMQRVAAGLVDHLAPGRSGDARRPTVEELRKTLMLRIPISEASAKVRNEGPIDEAEDLDLPVWAGVLPVGLVAGPPITDDASEQTVSAPRYITERFKAADSGR